MCWWRETKFRFLRVEEEVYTWKAFLIESNVGFIDFPDLLTA